MTGTNVFSLLGKLAIDGVDETKKALDDVAKSGKDAQNKLNVSFQDIGNKAGELGKKMALGLAGVVTASIAGVEATREFRQDYGKLETTFQTTNQATGAAKETFTTLFGILGEDDTAIETANHLAMMTNNEKDLSQWTDVLTGVYATFGDSLPLEGLAEAANETARVGQVTGPLADALNWAGVSEDAFNEKLLKCTSTQERERLIRETLNGLYGEASNTYKQVNGDVIANNEAQANLNMQLADATAKLEPLITKMKLFLVEVLEKLQPILTFIIDNINIIAPLVLGFMSALFALNIASKIMAFIPIVKALFLVLSANPIGLVIAGVVALIAIIVTLWKKCEWFRNLVKGLWEILKKGFDIFVQAIKKYINFIISYFKMWINIFKTVVDGIKTGIEKIKNFFGNLKDNVISKISSLKDGVVNTFNKIKTAITKPIEKARDVVKGVIDKIKGFFNFKVSLPKIKLPKFSIKPSGWKLGDLLKGSIPKLGIDWFAKAVRTPMLLEEPTAFGFSPSGNIRVGGEAGSELIGGTSTIMGMISDAVSSNNGGIEYRLDKLNSNLASYTEAIRSLQVVLSTGELVGAIASPMDKALGVLADNRRRGR